MRARTGFEAFYLANYGRLVAMISAMCGDRAEAEDVAQEAFARALIRWDRLGGYDLPEAWVRKVALRIVIDSGRRRLRIARARSRFATPPPERVAPSREAIGDTDLGQALLRLPMRDREVLVLHYLADLPVRQIAADCGISPETVKTRLAAGRRKLERELSGLSREGSGER